MIRAIIIGVGISTIFLGLQLFCVQELVVKTDTVHSLSVADFLPYSLICSGLVVYFYGQQLQKT